MAPIRRIKDHFYYKDLEKQKRDASPHHSDNPLTKILFLLPEDALSVLEAFHDFTRKWNDGDTNPDIIVLGADKSAFQDRADFIYLTKKDVDWKGVVQEAKVRGILDKTYDLLVNMDRESRRPLEHLSASVSANIKIGLRETKHKIYDILVETESSDMRKNLWAIDDILTKLQV